MSVDLIVRRVQNLFDDVGESWCDKDYVIGKLAIVNEDLESFLEAIGLDYQDAVIVLPNVPVGTTDLSSFQGEGQPLSQMMGIDHLEWRPAGADDTAWQDVPREDKIDDTVTGGIAGISSYTFRLGLVEITASSSIVDLRVSCTLLPDMMQSDSDLYIKGATNILVYRTAELIAQLRSVSKSVLAPFFEKKAIKAEDNVMTILVKQEQNVRRRAGGRRTGMQTSLIGRTQFQ